MEPQFELMRQYMGDEIVKNLLIPIKLREFLTTNPINPKEDFDLNPHLHIKHICVTVAMQIENEGIKCTWEDVMQIWLTITIYHGELLPNKT